VRLLGDALHSARLAEELSALIALKSDGNPFFVFELLRGLRDGQFLRQKQDGTWETTQVIRDIQVPSSIAELVQTRVADLDAEDKNVLDVAACCGFEFDPLVVAAALGIAQIPAMQRLARIERRHRLVRSAGRRFVFDHHQVQEALYAGMPELLREPYHAAIGEAIEARSGAASKEPKDVDGAVCVELARHFLEGAQGDRARRYLDTALDRLEKGYLHDAALRLADRALVSPSFVAGRERCELLLRKAGRLSFLGRRDAQRAALEEANELADADGDTALRARARRALGWFLNHVSQNDAAMTRLREAQDLARTAGDRTTEAHATGHMGSVFWSLGRFAEAREHFERHLALAREIGDRQGEAHAMGNLGNVCWSLGRFAEAREYYESDLAIARENGDRQGEAHVTGSLGAVFWSLRRFAEGREHFERSLALARAAGERKAEARATGNLGEVFRGLGRVGEAREHFERALALAREVGDRYVEALSTGNLGDVFRSLGRFAEAREHCERARALSREIGDSHSEGSAVHSLASLEAEEGAAVAAERLLAEALEVRRTTGDRGGEAMILEARGALLARCGRADEARAALAEALAIGRELSLPGVELLATARLATLPGGDVAATLAALAAHEGSAEMQEAMQARFLLWQATRDPVHLAEATRRLDFLVEHAPPDCRESMLANVRLHREIAAAAREEGLPLAADA
jgi:tetratricopeptide (TPR) repeat protein